MAPARPMLTVRRATRDNAGPLIALLAEAFLQGPVGEWLVPNIRERRVVYHRYFKVVLHHAQRHGYVDTTDNLAGVAIWYSRTEAPVAAPSYQYELMNATGKYAPRFLLLDALFEAHRPRIPHDYLAYVAVDPDRQSCGIGSVLLGSAHWRLDARNRPAYLEASNERNRDLYARLGYHPGPPLNLPNAGPPIWRMWRGQPNGGVSAQFPPAELMHRRPL
ncbi:GNAT family N-acetyltransferase [Micromonospora sp. NPDC048830]|uniref:GNAT family N-acetyltransferase n=1 Tax=Micromonospora sp. NPDC048830 TaxID=3364257 RepID=UPI0037218A31